MARRANPGAQMSLFPFLSILVCLIGGLVMLIVIMTLAQTTAVPEMDPADTQRAIAAAKIEREILAAQKEREKLKAESDKLLASNAGFEDLEDQVIQLRKNLADMGKKPEAKLTNESLQKLLENILDQLAAMTKEKPVIQKEIAQLEAELKKRQKDPNEKPPPLVVRSGGSGVAGQAKLFFVETSAAGLALHQTNGSLSRITAGSIGTDDQYNQFLANAKKAGNSIVIFLIRPDGAGTYNLAAGWAENQFQLKTGKLPLPGAGVVDLSQFGIKKTP